MGPLTDFTRILVYIFLFNSGNAGLGAKYAEC